ncbi:MAG: hypothetical protein HYT94_00760 [Parcubacteria group bacterium]|nr:hypothetical protein [Parcubacteria group bacterium]
MPKPKIKPRSKYIKDVSAKNDPVVSLKDRAEEFLDSGTPASYATQAVLALLILSGIVVVGAVAPGLSILARGYRRSKYYSQKQLSDAAYSLKRSGYIEEETGTNGKPRVCLTKKGEKYFQKILFEDVVLPEPKHWGRKWTFVLFDIPIKYTKAREALRWRLKALGFYQYQKSVWVYPHPCEKEILYVADYFGVGKFVEILSVEHLSNDAELKKHFELS